MVLKQRCLDQSKSDYLRWDLYKVWAPNFDDVKETTPPVANKCRLPILMIKLQPFDPATRTQIKEEDVEEWKEHVKAGLHESIRDKVVYQDMNKRRTIYNLGLRLTTKEEIDQLH